MTKYAIETAEKLLRDALKQKQEDLGKIQYEKDMKAIDALLTPFHKKSVDLRVELLTFKKMIEKKYPKMVFKIDDYGSYIHNLPKSLEEASKYNPTEAKDRKGEYSNKYDYGYSCAKYGQYAPAFKAEYDEIGKFILGLKLGTAVMADVEKLLNKINNLK